MASRRAPRKTVTVEPVRGAGPPPTRTELAAWSRYPPTVGPPDQEYGREHGQERPVRNLLDWTETPPPAPTRSVLRSESRPAHLPTGKPVVASHEIRRFLVMEPSRAQERFDAWRPVRVAVRHAVFTVTEHDASCVRGRLRRRLRRGVDVELAVEVFSDHMVCVHLVPNFHRRRFTPPGDDWWRVAHPLVDALVDELDCSRRGREPLADCRAQE